MAAKLPSMAVRNAIAFVDAYGDWPSHMHLDGRWAAERCGVTFDHDFRAKAPEFGRARYFIVSDEARAIAATGTLAPCLAWAKDNGFQITDRRGGHKAKPGYIPLVNPTTGEKAFISSGRIVYRDGVVFEGKPSRLAKESR